MAKRPTPHTDDHDDDDWAQNVPKRPEPSRQVMTNPLEAYYRPPGITVTLPTKGAYMTPGTVDFAVDDTIRVLPMTAANEILLKSPENLMSGYAIEKLLADCVPDIRDQRTLAVPDMEVLLLAIQYASYGEKLDISSKCPHCDTENDHQIDIMPILHSAKEIPPEVTVRLSKDLVVYLKPMNLTGYVKFSNAMFAIARRRQMAIQSDDDAALQKSIRDETQAKMDLDLQTFAESILKIVIPTQQVTNRAHIADFCRNMPREMFNAIDKAMVKLNSDVMDRQVTVACSNPECEREYQATVEFNAASFFERASSKSGRDKTSTSS